MYKLSEHLGSSWPWFWVVAERSVWWEEVKAVIKKPYLSKQVFFHRWIKQWLNFVEAVFDSITVVSYTVVSETSVLFNNSRVINARTARWKSVWYAKRLIMMTWKQYAGIYVAVHRQPHYSVLKKLNLFCGQQTPIVKISSLVSNITNYYSVTDNIFQLIVDFRHSC